MLSLTIQVPQSNAISHGTSNPYFGITIISPGTNSVVGTSSYIASVLGLPIFRHTVTLSRVFTVSNKVF